MSDIQITEISRTTKSGYEASNLSLLFKGNKIHTAVNTIRRCILDYVPTYAFTPELITITSNTSKFNNDMMKLRLSQLVINDIDVEIDYLTDKYWRKIDFNDPKRDKHPNDNKLIELYINVTNETEQDYNVTTNDAKVFIDGEEVQKFDKDYPILLVPLSSGAKFNCHCVATLSVGFRNAIWSSARNCYMTYNDEETDYKLNIFGRDQMSEYTLAIKACKIIQEKLEETKKLVVTKLDNNTKLANLVLMDEDWTLGYCLGDIIQNNNNVYFAGTIKPSHLIDVTEIDIGTSKGNALDIVMDSIEVAKKLYSDLESKITKLSKTKK